MQTSINNVVEAFNDLGPDVTKAAQLLKANQVLGMRGNPTQCVLSNYLTKRFPDCRFYCSPLGIEVYTESWRKLDMLSVPDHLMDLMEQFDEGAFPELDQEKKNGCEAVAVLS